MSLPPQILRIKRKRDDEPVDSLYIETPRPDSSKRRHTEQEYIFRRLLDNDGHRVGFRKAAAADRLPVPVTSAPPGEGISRSPESDALEADGHATDSASAASRSTMPRRYHLSRADLRPQQSRSTTKRRRSQEDIMIAVFVESPRDTDRIKSGTPMGQSCRIEESVEQEPSPARKRPGTRVVTSTVLKPVQGPRKGNIEDTYAGMQRFAEELDAVQAQKAQSAEGAGPKSSAMDTSEDYIYDTYIRYSNALDETNAAEAAKGLIGYLVIPEVDQPLWETYYDSDGHSSDEEDWDSEQDDENAENYYGADYPEDEVDSADEADEDAYRYRRGASDEEEYGSEDEAWSDDGAGGGPASWKDVTGFEAQTGRKVLAPGRPTGRADFSTHWRRVS